MLKGFQPHKFLGGTHRHPVIPRRGRPPRPTWPHLASTLPLPPPFNISSAPSSTMPPPPSWWRLVERGRDRHPSTAAAPSPAGGGGGTFAGAGPAPSGGGVAPSGGKRRPHQAGAASSAVEGGSLARRTPGEKRGHVGKGRVSTSGGGGVRPHRARAAAKRGRRPRSGRTGSEQARCGDSSTGEWTPEA